MARTVFERRKGVRQWWSKVRAADGRCLFCTDSWIDDVRRENGEVWHLHTLQVKPKWDLTEWLFYGGLSILFVISLVVAGYLVIAL